MRVFAKDMSTMEALWPDPRARAGPAGLDRLASVQQTDLE
jgi:hypothetical protein